jgi:hypothetical protein
VWRELVVGSENVKSFGVGTSLSHKRGTNDMQRKDEPDPSGLLLGSEPIDGMVAKSAVDDDGKDVGGPGTKDHGDDDSTDKGDSDGTDKGDSGDDSRDSDGKD